MPAQFTRFMADVVATFYGQRGGKADVLLEYFYDSWCTLGPRQHEKRAAVQNTAEDTWIEGNYIDEAAGKDKVEKMEVDGEDSTSDEAYEEGVEEEACEEEEEDSYGDFDEEDEGCFGDDDAACFGVDD